MKKKLMMMAAAVAAAFGAWADTWTDPDTGYTWTYRINGDTAEIYNNYSAAISPSPTGAVTIPPSLGGKPVTSIGSSAFSGCSELTSVTIPDGVTSIGSSAFDGCSGLTSVTIPNSATSIGKYAFYGCRGLTSVTIPDSIANIPDYAFWNCSGLTSLTIPNGVTSLGREAFFGSGSTSVSIPESVTYFGPNCFEGCPVYTQPLYRMVLGVGGSSGGGSSGGGSAEPVDPRYALAASPVDRAIASVTVDADCAIDSFVLKDGKVYDSMLYVSNTADHEVALSLPAGFTYKMIKGAKPLVIPASSQCLISITRVDENVFLVMREELDDVE